VDKTCDFLNWLAWDTYVFETFSVSVSVNEDGTCYKSGDVSIEVHDLDETFVARSYVDAEVIVPPRLDLADHTSPDDLDTFQCFPFMFTTLPFP